MKKEYLKKLELELDLREVENKKEILKKYKKRYEFGLEADMSEDEIEEMLGTPEAVAMKYAAKEGKIEDANATIVLDDLKSNDYTMDISVTGDDLEIVESLDSGVHVEFEDVNKEDFVIEKTENKLSIKCKKKNYFSLRKRNGKIIIEVPKFMVMEKLSLSGTSSDIEAYQLKGKEVYVSTVSGDCRITDIEADDFHYNLVSGDVDINNLYSKEIFLDTVSGDIKVDFLVCDNARIDTVSGDVTIDHCKGNVKTTAVTGDVLVNGEASTINVKDYLKGFVRR